MATQASDVKLVYTTIPEQTPTQTKRKKYISSSEAGQQKNADYIEKVLTKTLINLVLKSKSNKKMKSTCTAQS
jgi:hypothetical protein